MATFKLTKLTILAKNLDAMPEIRTDYKNNSSFVAGIGSLTVWIDAEIVTDNCDISLESISERIVKALSDIKA